MKEKQIIKVKSFVPPLLAAAVWVIWALFLPMYSLWHYILAALISAAAYFGSSKIFKDAEFETEAPKAAPKTGNADVDELIRDGMEKVDRLRKVNRQIDDREINEKVDDMADIAEKIFDFVMRDHSKVKQIRRFFSYYLPTTLKLLTEYDRFENQEIEGKNISGTMHDISGILSTIRSAFQKQLDSLFADEALDISADITVLEGMLKSEGINKE